MCRNSSQRMRSTKVSAPLALQPRNRNLARAASAPTSATINARDSRCCLRTSIPPAFSTSRIPNAGSFGSALPITLSTVKEMIFGLIISSSDTRAANRRLKAKYRFAPFRKYRIKLVFVRYVCISWDNSPISSGSVIIRKYGIYASWFLTENTYVIISLYDPYVIRELAAGQDRIDCLRRSYRIQSQ